MREEPLILAAVQLALARRKDGLHSDTEAAAAIARAYRVVKAVVEHNGKIRMNEDCTLEHSRNGKWLPLYLNDDDRPKLSEDEQRKRITNMSDRLA